MGRAGRHAKNITVSKLDTAPRREGVGLNHLVDAGTLEVDFTDRIYVCVAITKH